MWSEVSEVGVTSYITWQNEKRRYENIWKQEIQNKMRHYKGTGRNIQKAKVHNGNHIIYHPERRYLLGRLRKRWNSWISLGTTLRHNPCYKIIIIRSVCERRVKNTATVLKIIQTQWYLKFSSYLQKWRIFWESYETQTQCVDKMLGLLMLHTAITKPQRTASFYLNTEGSGI
jgi:hypothetical protein